MRPNLRLLQEQPTARLVALHTTRCATRKRRRRSKSWMVYFAGALLGLAVGLLIAGRLSGHMQ